MWILNLALEQAIELSHIFYGFIISLFFKVNTCKVLYELLSTTSVCHVRVWPRLKWIDSMVEAGHIIIGTNLLSMRQTDCLDLKNKTFIFRIFIIYQVFISNNVLQHFDTYKCIKLQESLDWWLVISGKCLRWNFSHCLFGKTEAVSKTKIYYNPWQGLVITYNKEY